MNKTLTTSLAAIGLAGAGMVGIGAVANAQYGGDDPTIEEDTGDTADTTEIDDVGAPGPQGLVDATSDDEPGEPGGRRGHRGGNPEVVAEALGITTDQLAEYREQGMSTADIATELGVGIDTVTAAILADIESNLAEKVAAGDITQEEADEKLANASENIDEKVTAAPGDRSGGRHGHRGGNPEAVAEALGVTTDELTEFRDQGLSLADIADQQGVSVDSLVATIVDDVEERLAEKVAEGDLTQEEADERLAGAAERVTEKVTAEPGEAGPRGPGGRRGPGGAGGPDAPADAPTDGTTDG